MADTKNKKIEYAYYTSCHTGEQVDHYVYVAPFVYESDKEIEQIIANRPYGMLFIKKTGANQEYDELKCYTKNGLIPVGVNRNTDGNSFVSINKTSSSPENVYVAMLETQEPGNKLERFNMLEVTVQVAENGEKVLKLF